MESKKKRVSQLLQQYLQNKLTTAEYNEMWSLLNDIPEENIFEDELQELWKNAQTEDPLIPGKEWDFKMQLLTNKLKEEGTAPLRQNRVVRLKKFWWAAAAAVLIFISTGIYFLATSDKKDISLLTKNQPADGQKMDRVPGGNKALLTLADGSQIMLDSAGNGLLAQQGMTQILKKQDGQLVYNTSGTGTEELVYNILTTPRGGQYKITLPDGSKVWLNAASSLKYPAAFTGNERKVEITGEAYFEVAKDASRPFKVLVKEMEVEVLGTHFNINGYEDEAAIRTTLLEGKVKIHANERSDVLKPGQQSQWQKTGQLKLVNDADLEATMAWKEGNFQFENSDINTVMRQLSRWYDVEIEYKGTISKHFLGTISRNVKLSQVLEMLQQTGVVKFKIEDKKIVVMP